MSALFSHAVRWEFCGHNPISSGIPVGTGGKRGPSTGVRISAKRQRSPLVLSPEQVNLGWQNWSFGISCSCFWGALGIRHGELGALRWLSCDFDNMSISVQHSYYWRRGGNLKSTKTKHLQNCCPCIQAGVEIAKSLQQTGRLRISFRKTAGQQAVRSSFTPEKENSACFQTDRNHGCELMFAHVRKHGSNWSTPFCRRQT
jgi:hypothetical protein